MKQVECLILSEYLNCIFSNGTYIILLMTKLLLETLCLALRGFLAFSKRGNSEAFPRVKKCRIVTVNLCNLVLFGLCDFWQKCR